MKFNLAMTVNLKAGRQTKRPFKQPKPFSVAKVEPPDKVRRESLVLQFLWFAKRFGDLITTPITLH
jgi:hypothetical protein